MTTYPHDRNRHAQDLNAMSRIRREGRKLAGATLLLVVAACNGQAEGGTTQGVGGEPAFARVINVVVQELTPAPFIEEIGLTGTVEAARDVTVAAEESGVIRELLVPKGATVRQGQPIVRLDDRLLVPEVERARAEATLARQSWERRKRLYEEDQVGSELAYLEARLLSEQAAAQLAVLEERLSRKTLLAPFSGILEDRYVEVGSMVAPGAPVVRIIDVNPVKVTAGVPERYATDVRPGSSVRVGFDVLEGQTFDGIIAFVGAAVNPRNRTFPVEFSIPNPGGMVKPEMVANVSLVRRVVEEALVVPQEAVVRVSDGYAVFVFREDAAGGVVESRSVTLGPSQRNQVVIASGLSAGDRIVVVGQTQVANGDRARVVEAR